jgi:hypothetical protein
MLCQTILESRSRRRIDLAQSLVLHSAKKFRQSRSEIVLRNLPTHEGLLIERAACLPDLAVIDHVPDFIGNLEDAGDMRLGEIVGHGDQPVVLIDRRLLLPVELLAADRGEQAAFLALVEHAGQSFQFLAFEIGDAALGKSSDRQPAHEQRGRRHLLLDVQG